MTEHGPDTRTLAQLDRLLADVPIAPPPLAFIDRAAARRSRRRWAVGGATVAATVAITVAVVVPQVTSEGGGPVAGTSATDPADAASPGEDAAPTAPGGTARLSGPAKVALRVATVDSEPVVFPLRGLERFDLAAFGRVVGFGPGPVQPVFEGDTDPLRSVVMELEVTSAIRGDVVVGDHVFVRLANDDLAGLRRALPPGTESMIAASLVRPSMDRYYLDPGAGVPDGATRYITGAPFAAFADGDAHVWYPLLGETLPHALADLAPE